jgi:hypothetical protein
MIDEVNGDMPLSLESLHVDPSGYNHIRFIGSTFPPNLKSLFVNNCFDDWRDIHLPDGLEKLTLLSRNHHNKPPKYPQSLKYICTNCTNVGALPNKLHTFVSHCELVIIDGNMPCTLKELHLAKHNDMRTGIRIGIFNRTWYINDHIISMPTSLEKLTVGFQRYASMIEKWFKEFPVPESVKELHIESSYPFHEVSLIRPEEISFLSPNLLSITTPWDIRFNVLPQCKMIKKTTKPWWE